MASAETSPFALLQAIDRQCLQKSGMLQEDGAAREEWTGVLFRIGKDQLLAPMNMLVEIVPPPTLTRVPGVKPWLVGLANQHGALIPVVDLQGFFFGANLAKNDTARRMLVAFDGNNKVGLLVNEVFGMKHFWAGDEAGEIPDLAPELRVHAPLSLKRYGEHYAVLDINSLMNDQAFLNATL